MTATPAPVLPEPEVARLRQALEDVRFLLERGYLQAALAAARAAITRDKTKRWDALHTITVDKHE